MPNYTAPPFSPAAPPSCDHRHAHPKLGKKHRASYKKHQKKHWAQGGGTPLGLRINGLEGHEDVLKCNGSYLLASKSTPSKGKANGHAYYVHFLQDRYMYCDTTGLWRVTNEEYFSGVACIVYCTTKGKTPLNLTGSWKNAKTGHTSAGAFLSAMTSKDLKKIRASDMTAMAFVEREERCRAEALAEGETTWKSPKYRGLASTKTLILRGVHTC